MNTNPRAAWTAGQYLRYLVAILRPKAFVGLGLMALVLLAAGCGSTGEGEWEGDARLQSEGDSTIDMQLELDQGGDEPEGSITLSLDEQRLNYEITDGTVDNEVDLAATGPSEWQLNLDGEIDGPTMRGVLYLPEFEDSGEFELERQ